MKADLLVEARLPLQQMVELLPFLALYRTYNTGVAFSLFSSVGDVGHSQADQDRKYAQRVFEGP